MFDVFVIRPEQKPLRYPDLNGNKALGLMLEMKKRGFDTVAETKANGISEELSLDEMNHVFADFDAERGAIILQ